VPVHTTAPTTLPRLPIPPPHKDNLKRKQQQKYIKKGRTKINTVKKEKIIQ
jgi:hypothetical protein